MATLADLTTLRLGGPIGCLIDCASESEVVAAVRRADGAGEPLLILGGGSNIVAADQGFDGSVARVRTAGIDRRTQQGHAELLVQAGESWARLVAHCVADSLVGMECLAGIPGSVGATPIQNVGAYGQEVSEIITGVRAYDRRTGEICELTPDECTFRYRASAFKADPARWVVLAVRFRLDRGTDSHPIRYRELAHTLGIELGMRAPLTAVCDAVLALRRAKGMVLDPADPDSVSAGSFFLNPVLSLGEWEQLRERVCAAFGPDTKPPMFPAPHGKIKTPAAWLIERAGFQRGYGRPGGIAISDKHTLALTNRGGGTAAELVTLAREIVDSVRRQFGVELYPEPVFVGYNWGASLPQPGGAPPFQLSPKRRHILDVPDLGDLAVRELDETHGHE